MKCMKTVWKSNLQEKSKQVDELLNKNTVLYKEIDQLKGKDQELNRIRNLIMNINPSVSGITIWKAAETGKISILSSLLLNGTDINVIHYLLKVLLLFMLLKVIVLIHLLFFVVLEPISIYLKNLNILFK